MDCRILLAKKHAELGIEPQPPAPKTLQIRRRLYLLADLIGLPPNAQQLLDHRTIPEIVDELLSNPIFMNAGQDIGWISGDTPTGTA